MKKVIGIVKEAVIGMLIVCFMIGVYFGSILQTSYRLCPLTADEVVAEVQEHAD
jgi:hypothetical protein